MEIDKRRILAIEATDDPWTEIFRYLSGMEKLRIASEMHSSVRRALIRQLRGEHPDWDEKRIVLEAGWKLLGGAI